MKKTLFLIFTIFLVTSFKGADPQIDEKRMNKDLEIAKNILGTLIKTESGSFFGGEAIRADYIPDYGVVFTIPEHLVYFNMNRNFNWVVPDVEIPDVEIPPMPEFNFDYNLERLSEEDRARVEKEIEKAQAQAEKVQKELEIAREKSEKARESAMRAQEEAQEKAVQAQVQAQKNQVKVIVAQPSADVFIGAPAPPEEGHDIDWEQLMITFLADYADLVSQLKPEEKIVVKQQSPGGEFGLMMSWEGDEEDRDALGISAEVKRQDITAYKTGKISRDEFVKRVTIKKAEPQKKIADLEMFSSVLSRYFSRDLTESMVILGKPRYEVLDGFGVRYQAEAADAERIRNRIISSPDREFIIQKDSGEADPNAAELEKKYAIFKDDIKEFLIDYGRTIRTVGEKEKVQLLVKLPSCGQCKVPGSLEITVPMASLKQYDQQKITKDKALDQISIVEK